MKYPNCQFENRHKAELFGNCDKPLRQVIVCPQYTTSPTDSKPCDRYSQPLTEQAPASRKPKPEKSSVTTPTSFTDGRYRVKNSPVKAAGRRSSSPTISSSIETLTLFSSTPVSWIQFAKYIFDNLNPYCLSHYG